MSDRAGDVLVIGYGNPGRLDDGLGPAVAERLRQFAIPGVDVEADYQLTVEDAAAVAEHDVVIFADAAQAGPEPMFFRAVEPKGELGFSSHGCEPPAVMALARDLFDAKTAGYVLGIRGYEFDRFGEGLSEAARANLDAAMEFLVEVLRSRKFDEAARRQFGAAPASPTGRNGLCKTKST